MKQSNFNQAVDLIKSALRHLSRHADKIKASRDINKFRTELVSSISAINNALCEIKEKELIKR